MLNQTFDYKRWADERTLRAIEEIDRNLFPDAYSFTLQQINHIVIVEELFRSRLVSALSADLVTTLGNPKAILFYLSFLPAFFDFSQVSIFDAVILYVVATIALGGVMLGYAYVAHKAKASYQSSNKAKCFRYGSGAMLVGSGVYVAARV